MVFDLISMIVIQHTQQSTWDVQVLLGFTNFFLSVISIYAQVMVSISSQLMK